MPTEANPTSYNQPSPASGHGASELILNVGLWGPCPTKRQGEFVTLNMDLENKLFELSGGKALYAHTFYTEDEFWRVYNRNRYDALRKKYGATTLPSAYDKVKRPSDVGLGFRDRVLDVRPIGGVYGVL